MNTSIRYVAQGFARAAKKIGRAYSYTRLSGGTTNERLIAGSEDSLLSSIVSAGSREDPQRLATRHLMPEYFWVQDHVEIAGRTFCAVGNAKLLQAASMQPVHVRSMWVRDAEQHGYDQPLRDYKNGCVKCIEMNKMAEEICHT